MKRYFRLMFLIKYNNINIINFNVLIIRNNKNNLSISFTNKFF